MLLTLFQLSPGPSARSAGPPDVRYRLRATVDDAAGAVAGTAEIRYVHVGAETLRWITLSLGANSIRDLRLDGEPAALQPPEASDSGLVRLPLSRALTRGDSVLLTLTWEYRPPDLPPRRQRAGRGLDLVGWYPRVIDATSATTVPVPAFATMLLRLDLPGDQVVGGTGIPLCGDPGWRGAAAFPDTRVTLRRDWYRSPRDPLAATARCDDSGPGRKVLIWYAEDVMELAYAMSPTFHYEEGDFDETPVHALYESGEERVWGAGLTTRRTETALAWILELGGRYPWPQLTVIHGRDQPGRALPMVLLADEPTQAAILNLLGLLATEQVLSGGARVFTVGSSAYQAAWFFEALGRRGDYTRLEREILDWDLDGLALRDEPLGPPSSTSPCATTNCRRTEFMSHQLRRWAGSDEAMRNLYRTLYSRFLLKPTVPGAFQQIASELIRPKPDPLYAQLPRGGVLYDDAVASARREPIDEGGWRTTVVVERRGAGLFPQTLWVVADSDTAVARAAALTPRETLTVVSRTRPRRVMLDPLHESHDWNMLNNQRGFGIRPGWLLLGPNRPRDMYFDDYFSRHTARDRLTMGWAPTAWYNDAGGWTFGTRIREDYLGRFELNEAWVSLSSGWGIEGSRTDLNGRLRIRNPVGLRARGWSQELGLAWEEGRAAVELGLARRLRTRVTNRTTRSVAAEIQWISVTDPVYVDGGYYDDAGTLELTFTGRVGRTEGRWPFRIEGGVGGGYGYSNAGSTLAGGTYGRFTLAGSVRGPEGHRFTLGLRTFAGATASADPVPRQRRVYLSGADPYHRFASPFLRSRGSILAGSGFKYQLPGGAGIRGLDPRVAGSAALGSTLELEYAVSQRAPTGLFHRVALAGFVDGGLGNGDLDPGRNRLVWAGDAGIGVRIGHRIGQTSFQTRLDLPLWVSRPELAQDGGPSAPVGFRWAFSFSPAF